MKKVLIFGGIPTALALVLFCYIAFGGMTFSEGDRVGTVAKFSYKGVGIKTWEGELHMGGIAEGGVAKVWLFSVDNPEVVKELQEVQTWGGRVKLHYKEQMWVQSWRGSTSYFIVGVEKLKR